MFDVPLLRAFEDLHCPNCGLAERVSPPMAPGASRYHNCGRMHGLSAPLIPVTMDAKVEAVEREDYLNGDNQATGDNGKAYMAVNVVRADGSYDRIANAGLARVEGA